jgi:hypothetical protein
MRKQAFLIIITIFVTSFNVAIAQEKLIDFTLKQIEKNNIEISWTNPYSNTIQLSIQRSTDNKNFRTIFSAQKPALLNNKTTDAPLPIGTKVYYRIYHVVMGGSFYFSNILNTTDNLLKIDTKQASSYDDHIATNNKLTNKTKPEPTLPHIDKKNTNNQQIAEFINLTETKAANNNRSTTVDDKKIPINELINKKDSASNKATASYILDSRNETTQATDPSYEYYYHTPLKNRAIVKINFNLICISSSELKIKNTKSNIKPLEYIFIYQKDSLITRIDPIDFLKYKDSLRLKTKDTLYIYNKNYASIHTYMPVYAWKPSLYIFNTKKGEPTIQIASAKKHKYRVVFKDEKGMFLFQLSAIKEEQLYLDKSNFLHAGWFEFELYEDEKLLEKNKIFIQV